MNHYFEDFSIGDTSKTIGRTITETDIVSFAGVTGDYHEIHLNAEFCKDNFYGQRIAHGLLVVSISSGLSTMMNIGDECLVAFYGIDRLRFIRPVLIGDTIHVEKKVSRLDEKDLDHGFVTFDTSVINQKGETVIFYQDKLMYKRRSEK